VTAPGLRLHQRTMTVQRAEGAVHGYLLAAMEEYDLTWTETAVILTSLAQNALKYALREERHPGNPDKKADEA
jgi:hypothetical protein